MIEPTTVEIKGVNITPFTISAGDIDIGTWFEGSLGNGKPSRLFVRANYAVICINSPNHSSTWGVSSVAPVIFDFKPIKKVKIEMEF
jgi:hypothetical protein